MTGAASTPPGAGAALIVAVLRSPSAPRRHASVTGASAFAVQTILGHTCLDVALRYATRLADDPVAEHQEHSPVAALVARKRRAA